MGGIAILIIFNSETVVSVAGMLLEIPIDLIQSNVQFFLHWHMHHRACLCVCGPLNFPYTAYGELAFSESIKCMDRKSVNSTIVPPEKTVKKLHYAPFPKTGHSFSSNTVFHVVCQKNITTTTLRLSRFAGNHHGFVSSLFSFLYSSFFLSPLISYQAHFPFNAFLT